MLQCSKKVVGSIPRASPRAAVQVSLFSLCLHGVPGFSRLWAAKTCTLGKLATLGLAFFFLMSVNGCLSCFSC